MTTDGFFSMLNAAPYGVYAVDLNQTILSWNPEAERILGHRADQVVGRRCCQVLQGKAPEASTQVCGEGCPSATLAQAGRTAPVAHVWMLCASGERKQVTVTQLVVPHVSPDWTVLVHLFHERIADAQAARVASAVRSALLERNGSAAPRDSTGENGGKADRLTPRELEVVGLLAVGLEVAGIAERLHISEHTVQNHIRRAREKLHTTNRLALVLAAQRLGLL